MSVIFDNFDGARRFTSTGWDGHTIVFNAATLGDAPATTAPRSTRTERFTYIAEPNATFRMRYEVSGDSGATWRLGDELLCSRH